MSRFLEGFQRKRQVERLARMLCNCRPDDPIIPVEFGEHLFVLSCRELDCLLVFFSRLSEEMGLGVKAPELEQRVAPCEIGIKGGGIKLQGNLKILAR